MHVSLRLGLLVLLGGAIATGACGGNVVVDPPATGTGTGGVTTTSSTGFGASTTTSSGISDTTATSTGSVTGSTTSSTTSTSSSTSTSTSSSGTIGACTTDKVFVSTVIWPAAVMCATQNVGNVGATEMCLIGQTQVNGMCGACIANDLDCSIKHCLNQCSGSPSSQTCAQCRAASCGAAFDGCAGTAQEAGSTNCAAVLGNGPSATPWRRGLDAAYFTTNNAYGAYVKYDACACSGGCAACGGDYCMGQTAGGQCAACLQNNCGMITAFCETN